MPSFVLPLLRVKTASALLGLLAALCAAPTLADTALARQDGVTVAARTVATGFDQPLLLTSPPDDPRLFVVEKTGRIRVIADGAVQPQPFLDLSGQITTASEQGLLGLAFHVGFADNQRFFVYYTDRDGAIIVAEGLATDPASLTVLLTVPHDQADNHNGGALVFGPDGLLYIGTGDGGRAGDPWGNAQNPDQRLGKILRIDVDTAKPYAIPPGNPFATAGGAPEIFALGLRNPWRMSFDGERLYIGDVGQGDQEEVNILTQASAGANLGWNLTEGSSCFLTQTCLKTGLTPPVFTYDHSLGCSITGGHVYRGQAMPALQGRYFFSDFCAGTLMSLRLNGGKAQDIIGIADGLASLGQVASFGQDGMGEVYMLTLDGTVAKLVAAD
jgi:glucose/arabinose dehydrogenase